MPTITEARLQTLLAPYVGGLDLPEDLYASLSAYLELLLRWNGRTNLTAIRDPEQLVQRQVGESLFVANLLQDSDRSLLDFGSGAGFPGIPLQLLTRSLRVTLAESQSKKASFLREAVRILGVETVIWDRRVEDMPEAALFDVVVMRAVDNSLKMEPLAAHRVKPGGRLLRFAAAEESPHLSGWQIDRDIKVPLSQGRLLALQRR